MAHTTHKVTFTVTSHGNLKKKKKEKETSPKISYAKIHYLVERALDFEPLSSWEPSTNGWPYLKQHAQGSLKTDKNGYSGSFMIY